MIYIIVLLVLLVLIGLSAVATPPEKIVTKYLRNVVLDTEVGKDYAVDIVDSEGIQLMLFSLRPTKDGSIVITERPPQGDEAFLPVNLVVSGDQLQLLVPALKTEEFV